MRNAGKMRRAEMARKLAERCLMSDSLARKVIEAFFDTITGGIEQGLRVKIRGLGTFAPRYNPSLKNAHFGRFINNMPTKPSMTIKFKPGKDLKAVVNQ